MYPISPLLQHYLKQPERIVNTYATVGSSVYNKDRIVDWTVENSLSLGDELQLGTAIPSKLIIKLRTNEVIPSNTRIVPYVTVEFSGNSSNPAPTLGDSWGNSGNAWGMEEQTWGGFAPSDWIPMGEFYVDSRERQKDVWVFTCYDRLVMADVPYISSLTYPTTMQAVWDEICTRLGFHYDSSVQINPAYRVPVGPAGYSCRQVMGYIAAAHAACVYMGRDGNLKWRQFKTGEAVSAHMSLSDYTHIKQTNPVKQYRRVVVKYNLLDNLTYEAGTGSENETLYLDCPFATQATTNDLLQRLNGFAYQPVTIPARGYPQYEQGDRISFDQKSNTAWGNANFPWKSAKIPWGGITHYETILMHVVFTYAGGIKMQLESKSKSDQQSEFVVKGALTQQIELLNENAVRKGIPYFGVTISPENGFTVQRSDGISSSTWNSDKFEFNVNGEKVFWLDAVNKKLKFSGTLEGADGVFSGRIEAGEVIGSTIIGGEITGSSIWGGVIRGSNIYGTNIATSEGSFPLAEMSSSDNMFRVKQSETNYAEFRANYTSSGGVTVPALRFVRGNDYMDVGGVGTGGIFGILAYNEMRLLAYYGVYQFLTYFDNFSSVRDQYTGTNLRQELTNLSSAISTLASAINGKASSGMSTSLSGSHNHGIPDGTVLMRFDGSPVTYHAAPAHSHAQI